MLKEKESYSFYKKDHLLETLDFFRRFSSLSYKERARVSL